MAASALLGLSQALTGAHDTITVLERVMVAVPASTGAASVMAYLREPETGMFHLVGHRGLEPRQQRVLERVQPDVAAGFTPFVDPTPNLVDSVTFGFQLPTNSIGRVPDLPANSPSQSPRPAEEPFRASRTSPFRSFPRPPPAMRFRSR